MANSKTRKEWVAVRLPHKKQGGPKKESEKLTHRGARAVALGWYDDGYGVELRRRRKDEKDHTITPKFPGVDRKRSQERRKAS